MSRYHSEGVAYNGKDGKHNLHQHSTRAVDAVWNGFQDHQSYMDRYAWGIGTTPTTDDVMAFKDVAFLTKGHASSLSLKHNTSYYILVRATDAAYLSSIGTSEPFFVDTTPPAAVRCLLFGSNVLMFDDMLKASETVWKVQGTVDVKNGSVVLKGSMQQNITLRKNQLYIVEIHGRLPSIGERPKLKIGAIEVGIVFNIHIDGVCKYELSFIAQEDRETVFRLSTIENMTLTSVTLKMCAKKEIMRSTNMKETVSMAVLDPSSLVISWTMEDDESGIRYFEVGIGSTPGGSQFMLYTNNGYLNQFIARNLDIYHKSTVYATVIAHNRAGEITRIISNPMVVDWTPPLLPPIVATAVSTGALTTAGALFDLHVNWTGKITDPESELESCSYGYGK